MNDPNPSPEQTPIDVRRIAQLLPHRFPFLLIDRVTAWEPGKRLTAIKNVTYNEPFFQGHFPGNPVMPGVLVIEALAQASGTLVQLSVTKDPSQPALFYLVKKFTLGTGVPGFTTLVVSIFFLAGIQLMTIGVIGEYIGRISDEVKRRPLYVARRVTRR